ncbi:sensor histidine kinase [Persephonella sp.]
MKFDQFLKARIKITLLISFISTLILAAFSGTIYYFYKEQIVYGLTDELKSIAFEISKKLDDPITDFSVVENVKIPSDTYVCVFNHNAAIVFYKGKLCKVGKHFTGFKLIGNEVIFGVKIQKSHENYHIYVGKNLIKVLMNLEKLKFILFYATFAISTIILVLSFFISKRILSPIQETVEKQERFTQNVSHDLRTPLTVIATNLYLIKQKNFQQIEHYIDNIQKNVDYMKNLVSSLLYMTQIGKKDKKKININEIIKKQLEIMKPKIEQKKLKISFIEEAVININANERDMEMLFSNLLENAVKYNYEGGEIVINIKNKQVCIKNTGKIIDKENLKKIFERFYREEKSRTTEGSGLGLSIVKEILDYYKFKIKVKVDQKYNIFTVKF